MAAIWWLSSQSDTPGPPLHHPLDWAAHALSYLALAYSLGRATGQRGTALLIAVWFGALDEVHQAFVPGRDAGIGDWWFDLLGALIGSRQATRPRTAADERSSDAVLSEPGA
ncbi:VanZ family protein [Deinococcus navajonensis]|uniref:VanZ family protein n=1 Tax=Deinococcus navajonensis TaxID=309884 RepID=A0ABV8XME2_9DEIO